VATVPIDACPCDACTQGEARDNRVFRVLWEFACYTVCAEQRDGPDPPGHPCASARRRWEPHTGDRQWDATLAVHRFHELRALVATRKVGRPRKDGASEGGPLTLRWTRRLQLNQQRVDDAAYYPHPRGTRRPRADVVDADVAAWHQHGHRLLLELVDAAVIRGDEHNFPRWLLAYALPPDGRGGPVRPPRVRHRVVSLLRGRQLEFPTRDDHAHFLRPWRTTKKRLYRWVHVRRGVLHAERCVVVPQTCVRGVYWLEHMCTMAADPSEQHALSTATKVPGSLGVQRRMDRAGWCGPRWVCVAHRRSSCAVAPCCSDRLSDKHWDWVWVHACGVDEWLLHGECTGLRRRGVSNCHLTL